jgi:hypothetical protein
MFYLLDSLSMQFVACKVVTVITVLLAMIHSGLVAFSSMNESSNAKV